MRYVLLKAEFYSPYTSVQVFAEHGRGPPVPPPSTLIGALAAPFYHPEERDIGNDVLGQVRYVSFWVPPYHTVENVSRHVSIFSQKKDRTKALTIAMKLLQGVSIDHVYRDLCNYAGFKCPSKKKNPNYNALRREHIRQLEKFGYVEAARTAAQILLQPASRLETYFAGPAYILYVVEGPLVDVARRIHRVGPKEGLVSVTPVEVRAERVDDEVITTRFYVPRVGGRQFLNCVEVHMWDAPDFRAREPVRAMMGVPYCIPEPLNDMHVEVADGWTGVRLIGGDVDMYLVVPAHAAP